MERRVVVTGLGIWSCLGTNKDIVTEALKAGHTIRVSVTPIVCHNAGIAAMRAFYLIPWRHHGRQRQGQSAGRRSCADRKAVWQGLDHENERDAGQ